MIQPKEFITKFVDALYEACLPLQRGQILTHATVEGILGVPPHTGHWQHCMNRLRRLVEDRRGITLWPEQGVGYKLLLPSEQLDVPLLRQRRALRQIRRGLRSIDSLPAKGLSLHQRRVRAFRVEQSAEMARAVRRQMREQVVMGRATPTNPKPIRPQPQGA